MLDFDIVFLDVHSPKHFDIVSLEKEAMGGSEASLVRIAEGLGKLGLKIAVIEAKLKNYFEPIMGQYAYYFHSDDAIKMRTKHYIQTRANTNPQLFPGSKKYIWLHDLCREESEGTWKPELEQYKIKLVGVSKFHESHIRDVTKYDDVTYIYNPIEDLIYTGPNDTYDRNLMVWAASPHKRLKEAVNLFRQVRSQNPKMQLLIMNPGYRQFDIQDYCTQPGISICGALSCKQLWAILQKSLCLFYPSDYIETFGLIVAEANAMGIPVATNAKGAVPEVINQRLANNDQEVVDMVLDWSKNGRPRVTGKSEFRLSNVLIEWLKVLVNEPRGD